MNLQTKVISKIKSDLTHGKPILLYDFANREGETDLIFYGPTITAKAVRELRLTAGAPLTTYIDYQDARKIGITTFEELIRNNNFHSSVLKKLTRSNNKPIDARFALTFDFRKNKTGCSHFETSRTIKQFSKLIENKNHKKFPDEFKSPGHVPLIISSEKLLKQRRGHSELIIYLIKEIGLTPVVAASEMLNHKTFNSMNYKEAKSFARKNKFIFIEGKQLI